MGDVIEAHFATEAWREAARLSEELGDRGVNIYVQVSKAADAYCGATILFDFMAKADLGEASMALIRTARDRFYADREFREAISHECFQLGSYVQNWNEPTPNLNF